MTEPVLIKETAEIACKKLRDGAELPTRANDNDAGFDLSALVGDNGLKIAPGERALVSTGIALELPDNIAALVLSRSGLALKHGVFVLNAPGLIDPGYRGEIGVVLQNMGASSLTVTTGTRIAQLLFIGLSDLNGRRFSIYETDEPLSTTDRGPQGFGSTGR